ncbi:MAG: DUF2703 domain-containing protein [Dehalococcoidia bacterium]|nr:DUF2703 domain-containing protein [Dehalococcoidia bacterium]
MKIELYYSRSTGITKQADEALKMAIEATGIEAEVAYIEVDSTEQAKAMRFLGSPTIRVEGVDVEYGEREPDEYQLGGRYYNTPEGWKNWPNARQIANTIVEAQHRAG